MKTEPYQYSEVRGRMLSGLAKLVGPVVGTLTPKGKNVVYEDQNGNFLITKDGFTIARHIQLKDPVENAVVEFVKNSAFRTNAVAGDGTTTSILFSDALIRSGFALLDRGWNNADLTKELEYVASCLVDEINSRARKVDDEKQLEYVAAVSASNDSEIAQNVAKVVKRAGNDGLVFLEMNTKLGVEIIEENGFVIERGLYSQHLSNRPGGMAAVYENPLVFITDKRLYYEEEVMEILQAAAALGENKLVVVAADFIGQAPGIFITNHLDPKVNMEILLIKESDPDALDDLATYLKGQVVLDKNGSIADRLSQARESGDAKRLAEMFTHATKALADNRRTMLLAGEGKNVGLELRIDALRKQLDKVDADSSEGKNLKRRIACLTNGITTVRVGGSTLPEVTERLHRYEDAINATRAALKDGYVLGGGITLWDIYQKLSKTKFKKLNTDIRGLVETYCQSSLKQIAENCNEHFKTMLAQVTDKIGYNANTGQYEDMYEAGIIEPAVVLLNSVQNSISVAQALLSGDFLVLIEEDTKEN